MNAVNQLEGENFLFFPVKIGTAVKTKQNLTTKTCANSMT